MTLVVETGAALPTANAYVAVADADTYHGARGNAAWTSSSDTTAKSIAIVRATAYLDAAYRVRFPGYRTTGRVQALEWPRIGAYTYVPDDGRADGIYSGGGISGYGYGYGYLGYDYLPNNVVPREIVSATCEAALREFLTPGSLAPDLARDDLLTSLQIGSIKFAYGAGSPTNTIFQAVELALVSLLLPASPYSARAARG